MSRSLVQESTGGKTQVCKPKFWAKVCFFFGPPKQKSGALENCTILDLRPKEITGVAPVSYPGWAKMHDKGNGQIEGSKAWLTSPLNSG